jgi:hypothetical protein
MSSAPTTRCVRHRGRKSTPANGLENWSRARELHPLLPAGWWGARWTATSARHCVLWLRAAYPTLRASRVPTRPASSTHAVPQSHPPPVGISYPERGIERRRAGRIPASEQTRNLTKPNCHQTKSNLHLTKSNLHPMNSLGSDSLFLWSLQAPFFALAEEELDCSCAQIAAPIAPAWDT